MSDQEDVLDFFKKAVGQDGPKPRSTAGSEPEPEPSDDDGDEPYVLPPVRPDKYIAMRLGKRRERLLVARANKPMRWPAYHELRDISFDDTHQQGFYLFFQAMTIEVMGKDLWPVVHAISSGRCAALYEYHATLYPAAPAKGEPLIKSIEFSPPVALAED